MCPKCESENSAKLISLDRLYCLTCGWIYEADDVPYCGYWEHPRQEHKPCGECDSCTGYSDYLHEQHKDRLMYEEGL